jgi:ariadne-1
MTEEEIEEIIPESLPKFESFQIRSFVELSSTSRWCPGAGCQRIATTTNTSMLSNFTDRIATCDTCSTCFCLKCGEEPHAPIACNDLAKWHEKCQDESETANWILSNTKRCPSCQKRIEKNQGCNHMTCSQCKHQFCWICMGDWKSHNGNYHCNDFRPQETDEVSAKMKLERFLHYYNRYHAHAQGQDFAKKQLKETELKRNQELRNIASWENMQFLKDGNQLLIECRRVLKYTYSFAFYHIHDGLTDNKKDQAKCKIEKEQFENHQKMLEKFTEELSSLVEMPPDEMERNRIVNQTGAVKTYMENVLKYIDEIM